MVHLCHVIDFCHLWSFTVIFYYFAGNSHYTRPRGEKWQTSFQSQGQVIFLLFGWSSELFLFSLFYYVVVKQMIPPGFIQVRGYLVESTPFFTSDNVFSRGALGYGPLLVDSKSTSLYVGARGHLFRLWLFNINQTNSENLVGIGLASL